MKQNLSEYERQFAVLIDADNISASYASILFDELDKYGYGSCRRIYGNWSKGNGWGQETLLKYSILPVQQFAYTAGKNATDMAMVIDAMDLLYRNTVDAFCLVTSDSDFTRLAMRLREEQKYVLGMGESKTPAAFSSACNKFVYLNLIGDQEKEEEHPISRTDEMKSEHKTVEPEADSVTGIDKIEAAILSIINGNEKKKIGMGELGSRLGKKYPDFDVRNYGYSKLSVFVKEEIKSVLVSKDGKRDIITKKAVFSKEQVEQEIGRLLKEHAGKVDNLSVIYNELKRKYPKFDLKDYGYSRLSSFLKSLDSLDVASNRVSFKKKY